MPPANTIRPLKRFVTGHDSNGKGIIQAIDYGAWRKIDNDIVRYNEVWSTSTFPIDLRNDDLLQKERNVLSLSLPNGTVCRIVDRSPGSYSAMHRTQSLDYGIVIEGDMELIMDSGEKELLRPGDVVVQRQTMHQWHNPSPDKWNRMVFCMIDAKPYEVAGKVYKGETGYEHVEDIGSRL